jgi:hypothetical protein
MKRDNYNFRELTSHRFDPDDLEELEPSFERFFDEKVRSLVTIGGYKVAAKLHLAAHIVNKLIQTGLTAGCVSDSRDTKLSGVRLRIAIWDAIVDAGLAHACLGSEQARMVTRYRATTKLLKLRKRWELKLFANANLARNSEMKKPTRLALVCLHSGKVCLATGELLPENERKKPISIREHVERRAQRDQDGKPDPRAVANGLAHWRATEDRIDRVNRVNAKHTWEAYTTTESGLEVLRPVNPFVRQIHVGQMFRAVRLYSWGLLSGQNMPKEVRRTMRIDGEPVAELDFSGMAPRMLYHFKGHNPTGDVYRPSALLPAYYHSKLADRDGKAILRQFIKLATNICFNVSSRDKARLAVRGLLYQHPKRQFIRTVLREVEGLSKAADIVDRIVEAHPAISDAFFTEAGLRLMTVDGQIMLRILEAITAEGKPVLGIHDAIVCKTEDIDFAREAMVDAYCQFHRFEPVIKLVFRND